MSQPLGKNANFRCYADQEYAIVMDRTRPSTSETMAQELPDIN
jgi:hypothetical protein